MRETESPPNEPHHLGDTIEAVPDLTMLLSNDRCSVGYRAGPPFITDTRLGILTGIRSTDDNVTGVPEAREG